MIPYNMQRYAARALMMLVLTTALSGCTSTPQVHGTLSANEPAQDSKVSTRRITASTFANELEPSSDGREVAMVALTLLRTGYVFGGKNRSAGVDCSGLVVVAFKEALGKSLVGNAATLARQGREIPLDQLRAGDLVFFNTLGRPFSHVGIYLGNGGQFIHAPNSKGRVRVEKLTTKYWAQRFEMARTLIN